MKALKPYLGLSLLLHFLLAGMFWLEWPSRKAYPTVEVRLVSLKTRVSAPSPRPASPPPPRPRASPPPPRRPLSSPKKHRVRRKTSLHRKVAKKTLSRRRSRSGPRKRRAEDRSEQLLKQRLARLEEKILSEKLSRLRKKVEGEGTSPGSPGPGADFVLRLRTHLSAFFEVPLALEKEKNLTAEIRLRLSARGQLLDYQWIKHSGNPLFDRAAEAAIKAAAPYPAPGQPCTVRVIFTPRGLS